MANNEPLAHATWDARLLARIQGGDVERRQDRSTFAKWLAWTHPALVVVIAATTRSGFYLALGIVTVAILAGRLLVDVWQRRGMNRREPRAAQPNPFGR
ncbi:MAG TPA: hypothetical protein VH061_08075 [Solirubrobacteraceae bacterium]|jgi:hypothetical protein|nr:hypothetical protein [Solirubrobacteraceae bacterium]